MYNTKFESLDRRTRRSTIELADGWWWWWSDSDGGASESVFATTTDGEGGGTMSAAAAAAAAVETGGISVIDMVRGGVLLFSILMIIYMLHLFDSYGSNNILPREGSATATMIFVPILSCVGIIVERL